MVGSWMVALETQGGLQVWIPGGPESAPAHVQVPRALGAGGPGRAWCGETRIGPPRLGSGELSCLIPSAHSKQLAIQ